MITKKTSQKVFSAIGAFTFTILSSAFLLSPTAHAGFDTFNNVSFGSCPNPGGQQIASFNNGNHWIVGNSELQWGSDHVFSMGNNNVTQCFCPLTSNDQPTGGLGTQTNWMFVGNMSSQEKQMLIAQGWIDVPDGSAFGLASGEFLARNSNFSCQTTNQISCNTSVSQQNNATVENFVNTSSLTGGNNVNFNTGSNATITTGNASSSTNIQNNVNTNIAQIQGMQQMLQGLRAQITNNGAFSTNFINN